MGDSSEQTWQCTKAQTEMANPDGGEDHEQQEPSTMSACEFGDARLLCHVELYFFLLLHGSLGKPILKTRVSSPSFGFHFPSRSALNLRCQLWNLFQLWNLRLPWVALLRSKHASPMSPFPRSPERTRGYQPSTASVLGTSLDFSQRVELLCQKHLQNMVGSECGLFDCPPHVMWEPSLPLLRGMTGRVPSSVAQPLEEIR